MTATDLTRHLHEQDWKAAGLRNELVLLGAGVPHPQLTGLPHEMRLGRCYELAAVWVLDAALRLTAAEGIVARPLLHHGSIEGHGYPRIGHAWVSWLDPTTEDRHVLDVVHALHGTQACWRAFTNPREYRAYDPVEALTAMVSFEHTGPWHARPFGTDDCPHGLDEQACTIQTCPGNAFTAKEAGLSG